MATLRYTRRKELCQQEIDEILEVFEDGDVKIEWLRMSREQQSYGNKSRWALLTQLEDGTWEECGQLFSCSECWEIFPVLPLNIYDGLERCPCCGAEFDY